MTDLHSIEAEQAIIGALLDDNSCIDVVEDLTSDEFYDPLHGSIFDWATGRIRKGQIADVMVLHKEPAFKDRLADVGGANFLAALLEGSAGSHAAASAYAQMVTDFSKKRSLDRLLSEALEGISAADGGEALIEGLEASLAELSGTAKEIESVAPGDALRALLDNPVLPIPTGLPDLDRSTVIAAGLVFIAGRSSMGKSALLLDVVRRTALNGYDALILTNEMTPGQISARWSSTLSGVPYTEIIRGTLGKDSRGSVEHVISDLEKLPVTIISIDGMGVPAVRALVRRWKRGVMKAGRKVGVVAIDYLQNMQGEGNGLYEVTSKIVKDLQTMQKQLDLTLLVACQMARVSDNVKDKRPYIHQLRDSGKIEEVADAVLLVHRDSYYAAREPERDDPGEEADRMNRAGSKLVEVDIAKFRHGALGKIKFCADLRFNRFDNWSGR
jgi:replicative DNA helicase